MAQVKYGSGIVDIKGSIGGHVFQGGNCGAIVRQKMGKLMPKSDDFFQHQVFFRQVAAAWSALSIAEKQAWNTAAPSWPHTNRFGDAITVSGYNVFMELNILAAMCGQALVSTAVEKPSFPNYEFYADIVHFDLQQILVGFNEWIGPYQKLMIFISDSIPMLSNVRPSKYYYAGYVTSIDGEPFSLWDILVTNPHFLPSSNRSFWVKPVVISSISNFWHAYTPFFVQYEE